MNRFTCLIDELIDDIDEHNAEGLADDVSALLGALLDALLERLRKLSSITRTSQRMVSVQQPDMQTTGMME